MNNLNKLLFLILLLGFYSICAVAYPTNWKKSSPVLIAPLKVDSVTLGEMWINPNKGDVVVDKNSLFIQLEQILKKDIYTEIAQRYINQNAVTKTELKKFKLTLFFDENSLILYMKVPIELRKKGSLDIKSNRRYKGHLVKRSPFSFFLNSNYTQTLNDFNYEKESIYNELNFNFNSHVLNAGGYYQSNSTHKKYTREYTRYIYDFENIHSRFTLGDIEYSTRDLQEQINGAGISIENDFSIKPALLKTQLSQYELTLKKPSTIEIFLNNSRIYKGNHPAGVLNLKSLPLIIGLNSLKILVTDINGRTETFYYNSNYHSSLLPKGITDYSFSYLDKSETDDEDVLKYKQDKILSGFYRYGVSSNLTAGINYQKYRDNNLSGLELNFSIQDFIFESSFALSKNESEEFQTYLVGIQNTYNPFAAKPLIARVQYRKYDKDFSSISGTQTSTDHKISFNSSYSFNSQVTLGLGYDFVEDYYEDEPTQLSNLELIYKPSFGYSISLRAQKDHTNDEDNSVFISFNWFERKNNYYGSHNYESSTHQLRNQVNYRKKIKNNNFNIAANYNHNYDSEETNTRLYSQLDTQYGALRIDHQENVSDRITNNNLRFALAGTTQSFNLSPYINNSFMVIDSNTESSLYIDPQYTKEFKKDKEFIVSNLTPYSPNTFRLNVNELPFGEEIELERFTIIPQYKSGHYLQVKTTKTTSVVFKLTGKIPSYATGILSNKKQSYEFMTGKTGNVFIPNIKPGKYLLQLDDSKAVVEVTIPNTVGYINLGKLEYEK